MPEACLRHDGRGDPVELAAQFALVLLRTLANGGAGGGVEKVQVFQRHRNVDAGAGRQRQLGIDAGDADVGLADAHGQHLLVAQLLGHHQVAAEADVLAAVGRSQPHMLGPHAHRDSASGMRRRARRSAAAAARCAMPSAERREAVGRGRHGHVDEVHGRRADEARHEAVERAPVELERAADLLHQAVLHDDDAVAQRHGLDLVVGDEDRRGRHAQAQLLDLEAHLRAQLGVEVGQRLVEQEHLGVAHDAAAERDALLLAAGELARPALEQRLDRQDLGGAAHGGVDLRLCDVAVAQAEGQVVVHAHVLVERVVLEHHGDVAVLRLQVVDDPVADGDGAAGDVLQPRDHAQRRRLAAARRPHQHDELVVGDVQVEVLDGDDAAVGLVHVRERDLGHAQTLRPRMTYFWPKIVTISAGPSASTAVALIRCHSMPSSCTNCAMTTVRIGVLLAVRMSANRNSFQV